MSFHTSMDREPGTRPRRRWAAAQAHSRSLVTRDFVWGGAHLSRVFVEVDVVVRSLATEGEDHHAAALLTPVSEILERARRAKTRRRIVQVKHQADTRPAAHSVIDRDVLGALVHVSHRVTDGAGGQLVLPQQLARIAIASLDEAIQGAVEDQVPGCGHRPAPCGEALHDLPLEFPGDRVVRLDLPQTLVVLPIALGSRIHGQRRADKELPGAIRQHERLPIHADVVGADKEQLLGRIVRIVRLVVIPHRRGTHVVRLVVHVGPEFRITDRLSVLEVHTLELVHAVVALADRDELTRGAIDVIDEAVAIRVGQELTHFAVFVFLLAEHHDVDTGVIPLVVRGLLVAELGDTRVDITTEDRHGPLVVPGAHRFVPGRRIAGTEVDQVGARIVGIPTPVGAATDLPGIPLPGFQSEVTETAVLRHFTVEVLTELHFFVRSGGVGAPLLLTGTHVVRGYIAAYP